MLSFLYDSSWVGQLLGSGGATAADMLYDSCYAGDMHATVACLEKGTSVHALNSAGNAPIMAAALGGSINVLQVLREAGCDVNHRGSGGNRPLHLAASRAHADAVRWLLQSGADPDARNDSGFTALGVVLELEASAAEEEEEEEEEDGFGDADHGGFADQQAAATAESRQGDDAGDVETIDPDDEDTDPVDIIIAVLSQATAVRGGKSKPDAPEVARAAKAIAAGGVASHLPPVPSEMEATADRMVEEALAAADAIAARRAAEGKATSVPA